MRLGYCTITWGGVVGDATGVTSVKDLFYRTNGSMERAVADIGRAGYAGVEMFDGNLLDFDGDPGRLRAAMADAGVELVSVYTGANFVYADALPDELHRIERSAALAQRFGATRLVVGGGARRAVGTSPEDYERLGAGLDRVVRIAERHGLEASYHPHLTTIVESPEELERIMALTEIGFCPDTAHLAAGGGDPAQLIRDHADRIGHVHLKDLRREPFGFAPLGDGELDLADVLHAVRSTGYDSWLMVELDAHDGDPFEAARSSREVLDRLLAG